MAGISPDSLILLIVRVLTPMMLAISEVVINRDEVRSYIIGLPMMIEG